MIVPPHIEVMNYNCICSSMREVRDILRRFSMKARGKEPQDARASSIRIASEQGNSHRG